MLRQIILPLKPILTNTLAAGNRAVEQSLHRHPSSGIAVDRVTVSIEVCSLWKSRFATVVVATAGDRQGPSPMSTFVRSAGGVLVLFSGLGLRTLTWTRRDSCSCSGTLGLVGAHFHEQRQQGWLEWPERLEWPVRPEWPGRLGWPEGWLEWPEWQEAG